MPLNDELLTISNFVRSLYLTHGKRLVPDNTPYV